jgi:hypothetical protein
MDAWDQGPKGSDTVREASLSKLAVSLSQSSRFHADQRGQKLEVEAMTSGLNLRTGETWSGRQRARKPAHILVGVLQVQIWTLHTLVTL